MLVRRLFASKAKERLEGVVKVELSRRHAQPHRPLVLLLSSLALGTRLAVSKAVSSTAGRTGLSIFSGLKLNSTSNIPHARTLPVRDGP